MKDCLHWTQEVTAPEKDIRVQTCTKCDTIIAKWDIKKDKLLFELPPTKTPK